MSPRRRKSECKPLAYSLMHISLHDIADPGATFMWHGPAKWHTQNREELFLPPIIALMVMYGGKGDNVWYVRKGKDGGRGDYKRVGWSGLLLLYTPFCGRRRRIRVTKG